MLLKTQRLVRLLYLGASQQNIVNYFSTLWGKPIRRRCTGDNFNEKQKWENETSESLKWLKGAKLGDHDDLLVIWFGKVHINDETATDEGNTEQAKLATSTADECDKFCTQKLVFCSKN
jgi:hypothetical protein